MKKAVIKDVRDGKIYFDEQGMTRNFEEVLESSITLEDAQKKYPGIIVVSKADQT